MNLKLNGGYKMTLVRLNNRGLVRDLAHEAFFRNFSDSYFEGDANSYTNNNVDYEVSELDKEFILELAIPGLNKDDLILELDNGVLNISTKDNNQNELKTGFAAKQFSKVFKLNKRIDQEKITAKSENGVLTVTLPKVEAAIKKPAREIKIS